MHSDLLNTCKDLLNLRKDLLNLRKDLLNTHPLQRTETGAQSQLNLGANVQSLQSHMKTVPIQELKLNAIGILNLVLYVWLLEH